MLCEKASSSITGVGEGDDGIVLLYSDQQKTFTLKEFEELQSKQAHEAKEKLAVLRVKVLEIVKEACEVGDPLSKKTGGYVTSAFGTPGESWT